MLINPCPCQLKKKSDTNQRVICRLIMIAQMVMDYREYVEMFLGTDGGLELRTCAGIQRIDRMTSRICCNFEGYLTHGQIFAQKRSTGATFNLP